MKTDRNHLVIYNLEMNSKSDVLASAIDWVNSFAKLFETVSVYTVHVGTYNVDSNVKIYELGGGSSNQRIIGFFRLLLSFTREIKWRKDSVVFHHMSSWTGGTIGLLYKLCRVPQGLWYSHSHADSFLKISKIWIDHFFSSTMESFPIKSRKLHAVGHGIDVSKFEIFYNRKPRYNIISIGRVARIKNLEKIIVAIAESKKAQIELHLVGRRSDYEYSEYLVNLATQSGVKVKFHEPISYSFIPETLAKYQYIFTGTPKSVDKAVLEGALAGCFVLSENEEVNRMTGMDNVLLDLGMEPNSPLSEKIDFLSNVDQNVKTGVSVTLSHAAKESCDLSKTTVKIARILTNVRNQPQF